MTDMKEIIADAAENLLFQRKIKKITVREIVEECNITRQAFYYHFADIPELLKWMLEQKSEKLLEECLAQEDSERGLHYLFTIAVSLRPYVERSVQTNYGEEIEKLLTGFVYDFFEKAVEKLEMYRQIEPLERKWTIRYHSNAMMGLLRDWTKEDIEHMDEIVHSVYRIMQGEIRPFE